MTAARLPAAPLLAALLALALWEGLVRWARVPAVLLPSPGSVATSLWEAAPLLARHALATGGAATGAFLIALAAGVALASLMVLSPLATRLLYPNLLLFQLLPKVALGPLFVVWLGLGLPSLMAFAVFVSLFPVAIAMLTGLRAADPLQIRLCQAQGGSGWQIFRYIRLPTALPFLFAGAKVAATMAFTGAVVGEFISADAGLGWMVMQAVGRSDTPLIFAALAVLCVLGAALYALVVLAEDAARRRWGTRR
ncbi:ABC transporter permease [Siccirubricoccus phaeus]|uniref:ABC transporter permease n=1 Tax=Siccirubricoccus phaeus TaxID=2595053 RepID=UPI0011F26723|nr:ABC transporter permease [Siccirubricoccus phaeus]